MIWFGLEVSFFLKSILLKIDLLKNYMEKLFFFQKKRMCGKNGLNIGQKKIFFRAISSLGCAYNVLLSAYYALDVIM